MVSKFYAARWILPMTSAIVENGCVEVAGAAIVAIHSERPSGVEVVELGDVALLPRLINAHTHLEFSALTEPVGNPRETFDQWIGEVVGYRRSLAAEGADKLRAAIKTGLLETAASGVIAVGEITTNWGLESSYSNPHVQVVSLREVINFSADEVSRITADVESYITKLQNLGMTVGVSPHSPYTVHWDQLISLCRISKEYKVPCVMHLAETKEEGELISKRSGVFRGMLEQFGMWEESAIPESVSYLDYVQALSNSWRALLVHGNYFGVEVHRFLGKVRNRLAVCFCPRTHAWFGHDRYPLSSMLEYDVRVCLGTDSRASNPDLSLIDELQFVAALYPELKVAKLLEMVTVNASFALGLDKKYGFLGEGASTKVLMVPVNPEKPLEIQLISNLSKAESVDL